MGEKLLILQSFYNKEIYISPEDEVKIFYEVDELLKIWKDIIIKYSNERFTDLSPDKQEILSNIIPYMDGIKIKEKNSISSQLDKKIVEVILWGSSEFLQKKQVIDEIYKKTRSSMFQYFYYDLIIKAYLRLKDHNSALDVITYMYNKNHIAYFYAILKCDFSGIASGDFNDRLEKYKNKINIRLLAQGEKVTLQNISLNDLIELINQIKK